ncbi:magnesium transporter NIPA-domain-containing protein [Phycomyces nitens]|nr:magnesium transporter NIPA-domain-containing protein [Phycomyces nitens]
MPAAIAVMSPDNVFNHLSLGIFIGSSFVFKKKGLLQSVEKAGGVAGEGYGYLKSVMWWAGMILMIIGELCNFVAYAFTQAILVTPLGALSVVISAVLSSIFLKERLTFQGKIGCLQCLVGAVVIVLHAPVEDSSDSSIATFKGLVLSVGFLVYVGVAVLISLVLALYCGPRWGKKNMLVYITICSLIGSLSVVFTQGFGAAVVHSISISNQFTNWFIYLVLVVFIVTLIVEIVYLNKALNLFNTALVTPTYYVIFTTLTIVSSSVLHQGFHASGTDIGTCVLGFVIICSGVALLHNSKSQPDDDDSGTMMDIFTAKEHPLQDDNTDRVGTNGPGPADIIPAPFAGIHRYASTTRRSHTIAHYRKTTTSDNTEPSSPVNRQSLSNTIGIGNTVPGENGYGRENRWKQTDNDNPFDQKTLVLEMDPINKEIDNGLNSHQQDTIVSSPMDYTPTLPTIAPPMSAFTNKSVTDSPSKSHRAQEHMDPFTSHRLGLKKRDSDEWKGLIDHDNDYDNARQ